MENKFKISELSNALEVGFLFLANPTEYSCWHKFNLIKGSPLRQLLEAQEKFEEMNAVV